MARMHARNIKIWVSQFGAVILCGIVLYVVHIWTYEWQLLKAGDYIRPQTRTSCQVRATVGVDHHPWEQILSAEVTPGGKMKIGILMMYDSEWETGPLMGRIMTNRKAYAERHGYTLINGNAFLDRSKPAAWSKLPAAIHYLDEYDYIFYMDTDAVVMNFNVHLERFIALAPTANVLLTEDAHGLNTGMMLLRSSEWTKTFLQTAFNQDHMALHDTSPDGIAYPFEYEQRAVHFMWSTDFWLERGLPEYPDAETVRKNVALFPQCAFNSYALHPLVLLPQEQWKAAQYARGDFIIHFAGVKGETKHNMMFAYLDKADSIFRAEQEKEKSVLSGLVDSGSMTPVLESTQLRRR